MNTELTSIVFTLDDVIAGQPLTPATVDLPTLRSFLEDVETLIKGDVQGASLSDSRVQIQEGSLKVIASVASTLASDLEIDLVRLNQTGDLDTLQPKRAHVIEQWQSRSLRSPERVYLVAGTAPTARIKISSSSQFQHHGENAWVGVEKYFAGKIVNIGGKNNPNVHIVLAENSQSIKIDATEQQLANEQENQLYKHRVVRAQGQQHLVTKELRNLRLIEFLPRSVEVDEKALLTLWDKGKVAWKNVTSASSWVEELRNGH